MKRGLFFFTAALMSGVSFLPAQEGALSLILDSDAGYAGRISFAQGEWRFLGAVLWKDDDSLFELGNLLLQTPWGGVGELVPRGILKELETPSLSRAPQTGRQPGPGFDVSFEGSPRRGLILSPPGVPAGAAVWSYTGRQNMGIWYENRGSPGNSWGAGLLLREGEIRDSEEWLKEEPYSLSPWLVSAGWWGRLQIPWLSGGTGVFWSAAPADPPGFWGRLWGEIRAASLKVNFFGGASSPWVWTGGGTRLTEQASYHLSAAWNPAKVLTLAVRFSETQNHPGPLYHSYRLHRSEGEGSLVLTVPSGELRGTVSRNVKHDETGQPELRDFVQIQGILKPGNFRIRGEVARRWGIEDRIDYSGTLGYGVDGLSLALEAVLRCERESWYREAGINVSCGDEKVQLRIAAALHREDDEAWQMAGKISLQWIFYEEQSR